MFSLTVKDANGVQVWQNNVADGQLTIGRDPACEITIDSNSVSRHHARITTQNGRCYLEDLQSANGVLVDGQRVVGQRDLGTASQIQIGDHFLFLEKAGRAGQAVMSTLFVTDNSDHNKLVRINDGFAGEEFSLSEIDNSIGRTDENFILLSDVSISRKHAQILRAGNRYTLVDLGSSNGTKLNGKPMTGQIDLTTNDRVHFGNVEFVFVTGEMRVDPEEFTGQPGQNFVLYFGAALLVLVLIVGAGLLWIGFSSADSLETVGGNVTSVENLHTRATEKMEKRDWDGALRIYEDILSKFPDDAKAQKFREITDDEARAARTLERGEVLVEKESYREALEMFKSVPEDSAASVRAKENFERTAKVLATNLQADAQRLSRSELKSELRQAHQKIMEALALRGDDKSIKSSKRRIERKMKSLKMKVPKSY